MAFNYNYPLSQSFRGDCINDNLKSNLIPFSLPDIFGSSPHSLHDPHNNYGYDYHHGHNCHSFGLNPHGKHNRHGHHGSS